MKLFVAALALAGCNRFLELQEVGAPGDARRDSGGSSDGAPDAYAPCKLGQFTAMTSFANGVTAVAPAQNVDYAIVLDVTGKPDYVSPVMAGALATTSISQTNYAYAALQPTFKAGSLLFMVDGTSGFIVVSQFIGPGMDVWSSPVQSLGLPGGASPGAPAELSNGALRMMVVDGSNFEEYELGVGAGMWQLVPGSTIAPTDLGRSGTEINTFPNLTPDGLGLTYNYYDQADSRVNGIHFASRSSLSQKFQSDMLIYAGEYHSPVLKSDCSSLYATDNLNELLFIH